MFKIVIKGLACGVKVPDFTTTVKTVFDAKMIALKRCREIFGVGSLSLRPYSKIRWKLVFRGRDIGEVSIRLLPKRIKY